MFLVPQSNSSTHPAWSLPCLPHIKSQFWDTMSLNKSCLWDRKFQQPPATTKPSPRSLPSIVHILNFLVLFPPPSCSLLFPLVPSYLPDVLFNQLMLETLWPALATSFRLAETTISPMTSTHHHGTLAPWHVGKKYFKTKKYFNTLK